MADRQSSSQHEFELSFHCRLELQAIEGRICESSYPVFACVSYKTIWTTNKFRFPFFRRFWLRSSQSSVVELILSCFAFVLKEWAKLHKKATFPPNFTDYYSQYFLRCNYSCRNCNIFLNGSDSILQNFCVVPCEHLRRSMQWRFKTFLYFSLG